MKTLVLGGGVGGVTTAYVLAKAGHEVTIVEERDGLGQEARAGNAGIIEPGRSFSWASPKARRCCCASCAATRPRSACGSRPTRISTPGASLGTRTSGDSRNFRVPAREYARGWWIG
jgi:glycine/D-amino acid oxidase-like deaminating enzyme